MCEDPIQAERASMVSSGTHESQDLVVPGPTPDPETAPEPTQTGPDDGLGSGLTPERITQGPVNAITVLTLLDKLVNMLDTVQENQNKMEVRQAQMEGAVRGIQADMTKLSKSHSHTSNTVSKLLDKSRKVSVTMKEVRDKMERQATQVKKLEANHAHLLQRNNFRVLIFQEENEIPASVFVKEPVPFPRDAEVEGEESSPAVADANQSQEEGLHTIDLSSDEDVGLEAELEEEGEGIMDLEHMEKSRAEKIKRSSLKKVDSLKKAFSKQNIEKKMTKIGTKIVSQEQREKIKKSLTPSQKSPGEKTSPFKISPLTFSIRKSKSSKHQPAEPEAPAQPSDTTNTEAQIELTPLGSPDQDLPFTEVHNSLAPEAEEDKVAADTLQREDSAREVEYASLMVEDSAPKVEFSAPEVEYSTLKVEYSAPKVEFSAPEVEYSAHEVDDLNPFSAAAPESNGFPDAEEAAECDIQEADMSTASEGLSDAYALSATLPQDHTRSSLPQYQEVEEGEQGEEEEEEEEERAQARGVAS